MDLTRRGFLFSTLAGAIGSLVRFSPLVKAWIPETAPAVACELDLAAQRFVEVLGERWVKQGHILVSDVLLADGGKSPQNLIHLPDGRNGFFTPSASRHMVAFGGIDTQRHSHREGQLLLEAEQAGRGLNIYKMSMDNSISMPISRDLRPGVPFTNTDVAIATDPATWITGRVLSFTGAEGPVRFYEIASGRWQPRGHAAQRRWSRRGLFTGVRV